jgi:hypothetical protein
MTTSFLIFQIISKGWNETMKNHQLPIYNLKYFDRPYFFLCAVKVTTQTDKP